MIRHQPAVRRLPWLCGLVWLGLTWMGMPAAIEGQTAADHGPNDRTTEQLAEPTTVSVHARRESRESMYAELRDEADLLERHYGLLKRVIQLVEPSVVHVQAIKEERNRQQRPVVSVEEAGGGVIFQYRERYFVVTNRHVIADTQLRRNQVTLSSGRFEDDRQDRTASFQVRIQLSDGRFFYPSEIRMDAGTDLAILFVDEEDLVPSRFGDSDQLDIGDFVIAVGSPYGLNHSVSYGIVSARGRRDLELGNDGVVFQDFIQTDAAINPGNSGGPLINLRGEVIGINTAIASNSGGSDGIGFTIPSNMVERIAHHLIDYGYVRRGFLGVTLDSGFDHQAAEALGLRSVYGARIRSINPDSPASRADLEDGDVILTFNGQVITNDSHLVNTVSMTDIGSRVPIEIYRDGVRKQVFVTIAERGR